MNKRLLQVLSAAAILAISTGSAQATLLSDLLSGGSIQAGDKVFDDWRVIFEEYSDDALKVNAANIDVNALNDGGMDPGPGLSFSILNNAFTVTGDNGFSFIDYMFGFRVTAAPGLAIKDNSLTITSGMVTNAGDNGMYIGESVGTSADKVSNPGDTLTPDLGYKEVEFSYLDPDLINNVSDSAAFTPHNQIYVSKNIFVWASGDNETASLGGFEQRFSQTPVPEPATLLLLAAGVAGLGLSRRKQSAV